MYDRPINYEIQWGQSGNAYPLTPEKIKSGWNGNEKPMVEHMNWLLNRIDGAIGYFLQGVVHWGAETEYKQGEIINHEGSLYRCIKQSKGYGVDNTEYWEPAFLTYNQGLDLSEEIRKIKEVDGYLDKYLKVSNPVTTARMYAGSFEANVGLSTVSSFNFGYSFSGYNTTGMYLNGTTLTFRIGGATKLTIPAADPTLEDRTSSVATTEWVQRLIDQKIGSIDITANRLPVGSVFITVSEANPAGILGYGTWVRFAEGEVIVGRSTNSAHPAWTKTTFSRYGAFTHQLTIAELPSHTHRVGGYGGTSGGGGAAAGHDRGDISTTRATGENQPHNNVQPSIVANIWRRTA